MTTGIVAGYPAGVDGNTIETRKVSDLEVLPENWRNLTYHDAANIFPMMSREEFYALKADIETNGLIEPIWLHPDDDSIIDGRNRHRACVDLGVAPTFRRWNGEGSLVQFVVSLNLNRRHLDSSQKAAIAVDILPMLEAEAKARQGARTDLAAPTLLNSFSNVGEIPATPSVPNSAEIAEIPKRNASTAAAQAAAIVGTNHHYVADMKKLKGDDPELFAQVKAGKKTVPKARREHKRKQQEKAGAEYTEKNRAASDATVTVALDVFVSSVADLAGRIGAGTLDAIVTDPPYSQKWLSVYGELARFAAHALKPGGSLVVMVGQSYLPEILAAMCPHVRYHWMAAYLTPGGQAAQMFHRRVNPFWKPLLWFVQGEYTGKWIGDVANKSPSNNNDKRFHNWGQSELGMLDILERFTEPGDLVCDPFVGGGTTGVVAFRSGRRFIGADTDRKQVDITIGRMVEAQNG